MKKDEKVCLEQLREIAQQNNGSLLSNEWHGNREKYKFLHEDGVEFERTANAIKNSGWPKNLKKFLALSAGQKKNNIESLENLKKIAESNNGELLSTEWLGLKAKYTFRNNEGFEFNKTADNLISFGWPKDFNKINKPRIIKNNKNELYLNGLKEIAKNNNGELLSTEWLGNQTKYKFKHASGEEFERTANAIKNFGWPKNIDKFLALSNRNQKTSEDFLNELKEIAKNNSGELLSTEWLGSKEKYCFKDNSGTIFNKTADNLKSFGWPKNTKKNKIR